MQPQKAAALPHVSNRYELLESVRSDQVWTTYKAVDHVLKKAVLIKAVKDKSALSKKELDRIACQAKSAAKLSHPDVEAVLDFGSFADSPYLVTDCLEGQSLGEFLVSESVMGLDKELELFSRLTEIVEYMHDYRVIHNNLNLDTILLSENSAGQMVVKVIGLDFVGNMQTQKPEVVDLNSWKASRRQPDKYSDIKALGLIFQKVLMRDDSDGFVYFADAFKKAEMDRSLSRKLGYGIMESIIERCLTNDQSQRFQSVFSLKKALRDAEERLSTWDDTVVFGQVPQKTLGQIDKLKLTGLTKSGMEDSTFIFINLIVLLAIAGIVLYYLFARVL